MFSGFPLHLLLQWLHKQLTIHTHNALITIPQRDRADERWPGDHMCECVRGSDDITMRRSKKGCLCNFVSLNGFGRV